MAGLLYIDPETKELTDAGRERVVMLRTSLIPNLLTQIKGSLPGTTNNLEAQLKQHHRQYFELTGEYYKDERQLAVWV